MTKVNGIQEAAPAGRGLSVYIKDEAGEMQLLKRGICSTEAKEIADSYWRETGRTAVIVTRED